MKNTTDYSDEFSTLKELHEDNIGKQFSDDEFNELFSIAEKANKGFSKNAEKFQDDMMGLLMALDEATRKWNEEKLVRNVKGNPIEEIQVMIKQMEQVVEYYANDKNANWGTVGTLANIHESLGRQLYRNYLEHLDYSRSVKEGIKRHSGAVLDLLIQANDEVRNLDPKKHLPDLARWKNFFDDLLSGVQGALLKVETPEAKPKQGETKPVKKPSLKEEAMELARKLGDKELSEYLETAPLKAIQRRINALREEVELKSTKKKPDASFRKLSKQEKKKFNITYKYVSDNTKVIKAGTKVSDENWLERTIAEASDKSLKLQGDRDWISISEVKFQS